MNANDGTQPWVAAPTATATGASTAGSLLSLDVTSDVSAFLAGSATNHGWLVRPETGTGQITFDSRETTHPPYLILDIDRSPECGPVDDGDPCTEDVCSSTTGDVSHTIMVGASCDVDGTVCNGEDTCDAAGVCIPGTPPVVDDDGNPCTLDACDPALGVVHTPKPAGASCSDGLLCNGAERCDGAGTCMPGAPLDPDDSDESTIDLACDPTDGVVHIQAPPIDPTVSTSLDESLAFLIEGADPLQVGVAPGTIVRSRAAAIEGYVRYANGNPVGGASVEVFGHPELGATITDAYGHYIMLINAGGTLTVSIDVAGFLPVQRRIATAPRQTAQAADAVVIPVDDVVTEVDLDSIVDVTVVSGSVETDSDGARQATLLIPPGVDATLQLPGGGTVAAPTLSLRLTEYAVGDEGPDRMPADLPPTSGYTYCVEISADEALQENATGITLSAPVALFVDNYRSFPIGTVVPAGTYDRARAQWVSDDDGRVIRILAVSSGVAQIDSTGDGVAETTTVLDAMGLTTDIREALADTYEANDELVFVRRTHFSPADLNFPFWPVQPSCRPLECSAGDPQPKAPRDLDDPCEQAK